ncbi:gamma-glutamyltransferase [Candidatus Reidiella endopervernicosa]|uniref:Gamma-glutamyltransferase n=1 Tax=Candidatus Reidiella endopervernicosa TaxID=2738883 RepID=A0A6N0I0Q7_9GAMM|nr:gamma-glutamyltransferase [Candidatus Reidiella endopervernicosa]
MVHITKYYGQLSLKQALAPAIRAAKEGFKVTPHYRRMAGFRLEALRASPAAAKVFLKEGEVPPEGYLIRQPDLARTLEQLAKYGRDGFYAGPIGEMLVKQVHHAGGIWTQRDLRNYRVVEREPIRSTYRGLKVSSAPPPSSGGIALATMLNILDGYDLAEMDEVTQTHLIVEAMRRAYRDRTEYLGDSDYVEVPIERLIDPKYASGLRASINPRRATPSSDLPGFAVEPGGNDTTHFSILDREGSYVSATLSINYPFGSGYMPPGTGVLLNDEMDDFSAKPGTPNVYGLVGAEENAIEPGKRMLSSMSPTFVSGPDGVAILGTPGGSRIITMVLLGILEVVEGKAPDAWVSRPRIHHQYLPDTIFYEQAALSKSEVEGLVALGHKLKASERSWGNMQAVWWNRKGNRVEAASDPRVEGRAEVR